MRFFHCLTMHATGAENNETDPLQQRTFFGSQMDIRLSVQNRRKILQFSDSIRVSMTLPLDVTRLIFFIAEINENHLQP